MTVSTAEACEFSVTNLANAGFPVPVRAHFPNPESTEGGRRVSVLKRQEGAPSLGSVLCFENHYPRFRGAPSGFFKGCPKGRPSVDSGLGGGVLQVELACSCLDATNR